MPCGVAKMMCVVLACTLWKGGSMSFFHFRQRCMVKPQGATMPESAEPQLQKKDTAEALHRGCVNHRGNKQML